MEEQIRDELSRLRAEIVSLRRRLSELEEQLGFVTYKVFPSAPPEDKIIPVPPKEEVVSPPSPPPPPTQRKEPSRVRELIPSVPAPTEQSASESPTKPTVSLEQRVGVSWLNKIGVVVLILAAVFFFQYAAQRGWISPTIRVLIGVLAGLVLLGAGEWTLRKAMRIFAAGVTGGGIALLYASVYAASPKIYGLLSTPAAFALMCVVTVIGVLLSLRAGMITTAILVQIGTYLTPLLLSTGRDEQVVLMVYLLAAGVGFLVLGAVKRWDALPLIALGGTLGLFIAWFSAYYATPAAVRTAAFAWALFALFAAYAGLATAAKRAHPYVGIALIAVSAPALILMHLAQDPDLSGNSILLQWVGINLITMGLCLWGRWNLLRAGMFAWTLLGLFFLRDRGFVDAGEWFWCGWTWVLYGLLTGDIILRAWWRSRQTMEKLDAALGSAATAAMFWATYFLLRGRYADWMGLYTVLLGVAAIALAVALRKLLERRFLAYGYLGQGLVLITLAMPIQFDKASLTIAWAAQATVSMLLARRLNSKMLLAKSPIVLILAIAHFAIIDVPAGGSLARSLFTIGGVGVTPILLLAMGLTAAAMGCAGLLRAGKAIYSEQGEEGIACWLIWLGALVWGWQTLAQLPIVTATWFWMALGGAVAAVGLWRRKGWLAGSGGIMLGLVAVKFLGCDTLSRRIEGAEDIGELVGLNWEFAAGVVLAAMCLLYGRTLSRRIREWEYRKRVQVLATLLGAFLILWAGSFEVDRYFTKPHDELPIDAKQAEQMGYSIWWALYAAVLLTVGFIAANPPIRYMALAIFAVTLGKVLLVDMAGIEAGYRIASFLALGALLVVGSLLYQRHFRGALANWDKARRR